MTGHLSSFASVFKPRQNCAYYLLPVSAFASAHQLQIINNDHSNPVLFNKAPRLCPAVSDIDSAALSSMNNSTPLSDSAGAT
jgi:hypothetical protein